MKAAKEIGLDVAYVEIRKVGEIEFLLVKRFDRKYANDLECKRILQEDFCAKPWDSIKG